MALKLKALSSNLGIVIAGFGSGHVRIMSLTTGTIIAEIAGHAGWITGMDLASASGLLITSAEDGYVRVIKNYRKDNHVCLSQRYISHIGLPLTA